MSEKITPEIERFLRQKNADVLVIKGNWGVGKTYLLKQKIEELRQELRDKEFGLQWFSYTSLFGVRDLDNLKASIFENMVPIAAPTKAQIIKAGEEVQKKFAKDKKPVSAKPKESLWQAGRNFVASNKSKGQALGIGAGKIAQFFDQFPFTQQFTGNMWRIGWLAVEEALICIDDLERKPKDLPLMDVLGLVSQLKEEKSCKVILILNDDELKKDLDDLATYNRNREKLIDIELTYAPDTASMLSLFISGMDERHAEIIRAHATKLGLKNLRTMKKIRTGYDKLLPNFAQLSERIQNDILSALVFFTHLNYADDERFPSLDSLLGLNAYTLQGSSMSLYTLSNKQNRTPEEEIRLVQAQLVQNINEIYGWGDIDDLDRMIGSFVKNGWLDSEEFNGIVVAKQAGHENENTRANLSNQRNELQEMLWHDLSDNRDELLVKVKEYMAVASERGAVPLTVQYVIIFKNLNKPELAEELIQYYEELGRDKTSAFFDPEQFRSSLIGQIDPDFQTMLTAQYTAKKNEEIAATWTGINVSEMFLSKISLVRNNSFLEELDLELLARLTQRQWEQLIIAQQSNHDLPKFLRHILEVNLAYQSERYGFLAEQLKTTLIGALNVIRRSNEKAEAVLRIWRLLPHLEVNAQPPTN